MNWTQNSHDKILFYTGLIAEATYNKKSRLLLRDIKYWNKWKPQKNLDPPLITWWSLLCLLASSAWFTLRTIQSNRAPYRHLAMASRVAIAWKNQQIICYRLTLILVVVSKLHSVSVQHLQRETLWTYIMHFVVHNHCLVTGSCSFLG